MNSPAKIGILMLNTSFPRVPGDIGNPASFRHPAIYRTVPGANPGSVVTGRDLGNELSASFTRHANALAATGVRVISTSCGFLSVLQASLSEQLGVPFIASSLVLEPLLATLYGGHRKIGILTFDAAALQLQRQSLSGDRGGQSAIEGLAAEDTLKQTIAGDLPTLDQRAAERELIKLADRLIKRQPQLQVLLLECTNMSPYKTALRQHTGLPVFDIIDAIHWIVESGPATR